MDPIGGAASIVTLIALSKQIVQRCRKYIRDYRDAPIVLSRFCDELESLSILFDNFQNAPSSRSGVLTTVLSRTNLLQDYERQLRKLEVKINKVNLFNVGRRLLFPSYERYFLDGLNLVQRIQGILESALLLDEM